ncbi:MAG: response regulator transcription factor [Flavobacteriales bacterium]|nr:response regulator transcription factor [Flavobacteriales bacterium]
MLKILLVDDERSATDSLTWMLKECCQETNIVGVAHTVSDAILKINSLEPELVFLDIAMPDGSGFEVLKQVNTRNFEVVFCTAYGHYAIKTFKFSAFDYLLKPIDIDELTDTIGRIRQNRNLNHADRLDKLLDNIESTTPSTLTIHTTESIHFIPVSNIVRIEADGKYSTFHLDNGKKLLVSQNIGKYENMLGREFYRCHQSHLINLNKIDSFQKTDGGFIKMNNGSTVDLARRKRAEFIEIMESRGI